MHHIGTGDPPSRNALRRDKSPTTGKLEWLRQFRGGAEGFKPKTVYSQKVVLFRLRAAHILYTLWDITNMSGRAMN